MEHRDYRFGQKLNIVSERRDVRFEAQPEIDLIRAVGVQRSTSRNHRRLKNRLA